MILSYPEETLLIKSLITYFAAFVVLFIVKPIFQWLTSKTKTKIDDKVIRLVARGLFVVISLYATFLFIYSFYQATIVEKAFHSIIVLLVFFVIYRTTKFLLEHLIDYITRNRGVTKADYTFASVIKNLILIIYAFFLVYFLLDIWGISVTPLLASAGIVGLAIGFAAKDLIENVISGIIIFFDPPFRVGDVVHIENYTGKIVDIGIRNTKILTFDNELVLIPNSKIVSANLTNYNLPDDKVRVNLKIGVSYDSDPEKVKRVLREILDSVKTILKDPEPQVLFVEFGDFALIFELRFWVQIKDKFDTIDRVNSLIWKRFREEGIEIPFPIREVYLKKSE